MKNILCIWLIALVPYLPLMAQWYSNPPLSELLEIGLPVVEIQTTDEEEPTYIPVNPPEGGVGYSIQAEKVTGRLRLLQNQDTLYDSGNYIKGLSGMTIKVRGNTSAYTVIKPYKIKLQEKADLLIRGNDDKYKDKEWLLIDGNDLRTVVGFWANELMEMAWTPALRFVNVVMNGQYRGLYLLIESVKRNSSCRIDVDKYSGSIFELDAYWWNTSYYYISEHGYYYTLKYPDEDDATDIEKEYIQHITNLMEQSILDGSYEDYIDVPAFARWILVHDILGSYDAAGSNIFFAKYDDSEHSKITMPLTWDFNCIMKPEHGWSRIHESDYCYFPLLFNNSNIAFTEEYIQLWNRYSEHVFDEINTRLHNFIASELREQLDVSRKKMMETLNFEDWTWTDDAEYCINWFTNHKIWMDEAMQELMCNTHIRDNRAWGPSDDNLSYDLAGRRVWNTHASRQIIVINGKKCLLHP